ncbi:MAG: hypothetical protein IT169_02325 [Bryobacterales bacterium]|nr:hypothetical protein [Bryobacterales bacterium]
MTSDTRQHAHQLIDRMPETQLSGLVQFLETIVDPVATALRNAPLDDEPETGDEKAAVAEAKTWLMQNGGKGIPHAEAMRRLGLE